MSRRVLILVGLLTAMQACPAFSQPSDIGLPEPCRERVSEELAVLEKRKSDLEGKIAAQTEISGNEKGVETTKGLQKHQEDLLQILVQIECQKARIRLESLKARPKLPKVTGTAANAVEVATYYATNRKPTDGVEPSTVYGSLVDAKLQYGRAIVSIPFTHTPGSIELPRFWRLERVADPRRHFVLRSVKPLGTSAAHQELTAKLAASKSRSLLLFVHGYNMGFQDAAMRTAQLAHDLKFPGVPFFFSWPSAARLLAYLQDAEAAQLSEAIFEQLLDDLSKLPVDDIYIVAHSMGNRIVTQALKARVDRGKDTKHLRELLLAAPDINAELFRSVIAPRLAALKGTRTTVYASSSDLALMASKVVHGFRRVGETANGVLVYPGLETIDASSVSLLIRGYGHSYLMDSPSVLKDIATLIRERLSAKHRGLSEVGTSPNTSWKLPP